MAIFLIPATFLVGRPITFLVSLWLRVALNPFGIPRWPTNYVLGLTGHGLYPVLAEFLDARPIAFLVLRWPWVAPSSCRIPRWPTNCLLGLTLAMGCAQFLQNSSMAGQLPSWSRAGHGLRPILVAFLDGRSNCLLGLTLAMGCAQFW